MQIYYYHNDHLGTPNELTNNDGKVVWLADYLAWGDINKEKYVAQNIDNLEIAANELQPIRFQGQVYDDESGLHYNRFRYYDPDMGMFVSRDPIGLMGGDNVFAYAPNPTGWVDPLGLTAGVLGCAAGPIGCGIGISVSTIAALIVGATATTIPGDTPKADTKTDDSPCTSGNCCPECTPVKGTIGYRSDPEGSAPHHNKPGPVRNAQTLGIPATVGNQPAPHFNMYQMHQNPQNCQCFWKDLKVAIPPIPQPGWYGPLPSVYSR